jgi:2-dehydropantoate 2-reductase
LGAVLASAAADTGHEVTVCVRTPIDTLELVRDGRSAPLPVTLLSSPPPSLTSDPPPSPVVGAGRAGRAGQLAADVVFVTVKAIDTASAAPWLTAFCGSSTVTVAVQNGLDHAARLAPYLPAAAGPAVPGLAYIAAERLGPGKVKHINGNLLIVPTASAAPVADALSAGIKVRGNDDMVTASWRKLLANVVSNPITALTMRRIDVMGAPEIQDLARGLLAEAMAVGRAEGAMLADSDAERIVESSAQYGSETGSSMLYDRLAGRPMEHRYLTGEVVRRAAIHGIPVPLNSAILALLEALDAAAATSF